MDARPFIQAVQQLKGDFVRLLESISALCALSAVRVEGQQERELLESALQVLMQNQDLERCSVFLRQGERLVSAAGLDWADLIHLRAKGGARAPTSFALGEGIIGLAAASGELQHSRDCRTDSRFMRSTGGAQGLPFGSLISVPIRGGGEVIGVLNVSHPHAQFFNESHERTLTVFSNFLGQMVVNNRLVHRMEQLVAERTRQLEEALASAEELKRRYEQLSAIDELTELHNRRHFFPEARAALARALRHGRPFALLLIDIDHFKYINDSFGHAVGDRVLRRASEVIRNEVREGDILARFGGEEFVVALPETDLAGAKRLAERICGAMKRLDWSVGARRHEVTLSIGIADLGPHVESREPHQALDTLLREADQALYFGKENGRDQCQAFADIACELRQRA